MSYANTELFLYSCSEISYIELLESKLKNHTANSLTTPQDGLSFNEQSVKETAKNKPILNHIQKLNMNHLENSVGS